MFIFTKHPIESTQKLLNMIESEFECGTEPLQAMKDFTMDCQMTAICSDRELPKVIDDFQYDGDESNFTQLFNMVIFLILVLNACKSFILTQSTYL